jgi:hypothetical protein
MLNLSVIPATEAVISRLVYLYDGAIQDESAVVALRLQCLTVHVGYARERAVDECALPP